MKKWLALVSVALWVCGLHTDPALGGPSKDAMKQAVTWLRTQQFEDGSYGIRIPIGKGKFKEIGDVGITGLVVTAMAESPLALRTGHGPFMSKAVDYLLKHVNDDGSISAPRGGLKNYQTSIAIMALAAVNDDGTHDKVILLARGFLLTLQANAKNGYDAEKHKRAFGGFGYSDDLRPDLSNTVMALRALKAAKLPKGHPAWTDVQKFLERSQNLSATNDFDRGRKGIPILNDGGFRYAPDETKVKGGGAKAPLRSYASMTYAGLLSFVYANVDKKDPRVKAAYDWIAKNYSLEENAGLKTAKHPKAGADGLFYSYHVMAKALAAYGSEEIVGADGVRHNWARELSEKLIAQQSKEGWWVNAKSPRWWENNKVLVTSYAIMALTHCHDGIEEQTKELTTLAEKTVELNTALEAAKKKADNEKAIKALEAERVTVQKRQADLTRHNRVKAIRAQQTELEKNATETEEMLKERVKLLGADADEVKEARELLAFTNAKIAELKAKGDAIATGKE